MREGEDRGRKVICHEGSQLNLMSTYRSPSINGMTLVIVAGWFVINLLLLLATNSLNAHSETKIETQANLASTQLLTPLGQSWMAGTILGLITFISWLATGVSSSFYRFSTRTIAAIGCILVLTACCTPDMLRHAISVSGTLLVQPIIFVILAIPCWTISLNDAIRASWLSKITEASQQPKLPQFRIGELITSTTLVALLLAASRQYTPPVANLVYWPVLIGSLFFLQTIAALTIRVVMFRQLRVLVFLVPVLVLTTLGLARAEGLATQGSWQAEADLRLYSFLIFAFTLSIAVLCSSDGWETSQKSKDTEKSELNQDLP